MTEREHLQQFANLFHRAWAMWAGQDGATPVETLHLERALDNILWSDMILKWDEMVKAGVIENPGLDEVDAEVERVKGSPLFLIPEHLREEVAP